MSQIDMLYTLNLHNVLCLYLNKEWGAHHQIPKHQKKKKKEKKKKERKKRKGKRKFLEACNRVTDQER